MVKSVLVNKGTNKNFSSELGNTVPHPSLGDPQMLALGFAYIRETERKLKILLIFATIFDNCLKHIYNLPMRALHEICTLKQNVNVH